MVRRQVIVQLDEGLVERLDEQAKVAGVSRSELLRRAARAYLDSAQERAADRRHAESYREHPQGWEWDDRIEEWDSTGPAGEKETGAETG